MQIGRLARRWILSANRAIVFVLLAIISLVLAVAVLVVVKSGNPSPALAPAPETTHASRPASGHPYVQPGTQGYRGAVSALTIYSPANGKVPAGSACSWASGGILSCPDDNLTLDHTKILGSLEWKGCGTLSVTNSVVDWQSADGNWFSVDATCESPSPRALITVSNSTFETAGDAPYTGMSDVGAISEYANEIPEHISNSLFKDFPQGLDPAVDSVIRDNEIYVADGLKCWQDAAAGTTATCHSDGLFNEGSSNNTYEGNYINAGTNSATAALFYQSDSAITGNRIIGNYIAGGSFTLYNENAAGLDVENNTFGGYLYGSCALKSGGSWGSWKGNIRSGGSAVIPNSGGCN